MDNMDIHYAVDVESYCAQKREQIDVQLFENGKETSYRQAENKAI